jgi:polysaccharide chain length determinant protein (PEP-CTERM system associated)
VIPGRPLQPEDLLKLVRRWPQILVPFVVTSLVTMVVVKGMPDRYNSETLILVVPQRVPETYVRSTVTSRISDRLQSLNQQVMSRTRLEPVIREFNLYPDLVQQGLMEDVIARMRRDITAQVARGDAFRIGYRAGDPHTAMKVTERLASLYIGENLRDREILADGTNQFLESQLAEAKARLIDQERKLEDYKRRYAGQLPTQVGTNLQVIQSAELQLQNVVDSLNRDKDRRMVLEGALADERARGTLPPETPGNAVQPPVSTRVAPSAGQLEREAKTLEDMLSRFTPDHPDVTRQRRIVADLQKKVNEETAALAGESEAPTVQVDPIEAARLARVATIRGELAALARQIPQKEQEEQRLRAVIAEYQARVEAAPTRDSELIELTRDYNTVQNTYTSLLAKKEEAQIAANLERYQIGEQFKILDPPSLPEKPSSPNRPLLYGIGSAVGLAIGLAIALLLELRDSTFKTDGDIVASLGLPVLALIPELITDEERTAKRRRRAITSLVTAGAAAAVAGVLLWVFRG